MLIRSRAHGFTLVEVMVVVAIAGVLASLAYPSFVAQIERTRRADGLVALMQIEAAQARFRSNSSRYGTLAEIGASGKSAAGYYGLQATGNTADGFTALAVAAGAQAHDAVCRYIALDVLGATTIYRSGPDASATNPDSDNQKCWSL